MERRKDMRKYEKPSIVKVESSDYIRKVIAAFLLE